jgi:hypothetical protein
VDRVHAAVSWVNGPPLNNSRWFFDLRFRFNEAEGVSLDLITIVGDVMDSSGFTQTEQRQGDQAARRRHGRARWHAGVPLFLSYGCRFSVRFAPMGTQWWGELVYANLSWKRVATRSSNGEAAQLASDDDVRGLWWCSILKNRMRTFLAAPSCSLSDPISPRDSERSSLKVA